MTNASEVLADINSGAYAPGGAVKSKDAINPDHYKKGWSDEAELISITENLTGNGAQAVQYIARSTRLDQKLIKGDPIEDLEKALWFVSRELKRLRKKYPAKTVHPDFILGPLTITPAQAAERKVMNAYANAGIPYVR